MAETQKMWSRRHNRSNKRTDLAYPIAWSKHGLRPVKSRKLASEKFEYRSPGRSRHRRCHLSLAVMSIYAPSNAHHSQMVRCTPRRFEVISSGSIGLVIHPVTSRLRATGGSVESATLAGPNGHLNAITEIGRRRAKSQRSLASKAKAKGCPKLPQLCRYRVKSKTFAFFAPRWLARMFHKT